MRDFMSTASHTEAQPGHSRGNASSSVHRKSSVKKIAPAFPSSLPMIQRKPCPCDGGCPSCLPIQAKLSIGKPDDKYEEEADRVSERVMRMPEPTVQRAAGCSSCLPREEETIQTKSIGDSITPIVQRQESEEGTGEEDEAAQAKFSPGREPPEPDENFSGQLHSMGGGGRSLSPSERSFFEPRFRRDFSPVRIHTGEKAAAAAKSLQARAFTVGKNIYFNSSEYAPNSDSGKQLMAHELTHVVQQGASGQQKNGAGSAGMPTLQRDEEDEPMIPTLKALSAVANANNMMLPNIWFDSWGNDLRDNDNYGKIDDKPEQGHADGVHYSGTYSAKICKGMPFLTIDQCLWSPSTITDLKYKVCIDIPKEAYKAAGFTMPSTRRIRKIIPWFQKSKKFMTWKAPKKPTMVIPGDFIAVQSGGHSHSGIASSWGLPNSWGFNTIHLPGPTARRSIAGPLTYYPSSTNDVFNTPWPLDVDFVARPIV